MCSEFEQEVLQCLKLGVRWTLSGERCWCTCKRLFAWKRGEKLHSEHCKRANSIVIHLERKNREAAP